MQGGRGDACPPGIWLSRREHDFAQGGAGRRGRHVPGSEGLAESEEEALIAARKCGFPVMLRATAWGAGICLAVGQDEQRSHQELFGYDQPHKGVCCPFEVLNIRMLTCSMPLISQQSLFNNEGRLCRAVLSSCAVYRDSGTCNILFEPVIFHLISFTGFGKQIW